MTGRIRIAPSVLSADLLGIKEQVAAAEAGGADWIHVDVMDGRFVPNLTFGAALVAALRRITALPLDVHLMVVEPERHVPAFADAGASVVTLHAEATVHAQRHLAAIRERGLKAGLALNPGTPLSVAEDLLDDVDLLLIMSVNPGFPGQAYIPASTDKIRRARAMLTSRQRPALLEVDGGITPDTIVTAAAAGADTFVAGSAVFGAADPGAAVRELKRLAHPQA
ncbi:MAG TPA: ribulose-phosphate 3-epimerase [Gemmatimonadales bacterium]|nr:ribulose-phosphate 3-epimerase [Gemmatimonadales bacterium]